MTVAGPETPVAAYDTPVVVTSFSLHTIILVVYNGLTIIPVFIQFQIRERERETAERGYDDLAGSPSIFPVLHSPSPIPQFLVHAKHLSEQAIIVMTGHWG